MKLILKIILIFSLALHAKALGQRIADDPVLRKLSFQIHEHPDKVINIGKQMLKNETDINRTIHIYMLISTASLSKRNFSESLHYILKARDLSKKIDNVQTKTNVLIYLAVQYQQMELYDKSFETLNEADKYLAKIPEGMPDKYIETARSNALRGMIYKSQSNSEIALEKFLIAIKNLKKVMHIESTPANLSIFYYNIGNCYINLDQIEKAPPAFRLAIKYAKINNSKSLEAYALKGMGVVYKYKRENQTALKFLTEAENLSKSTGDLILNKTIYKEMAENYLTIGKQKLYQEYNKKYDDTLIEIEQNELNSINESLNNHNKETLAKSKEIIDHYNYMIIVAAGIGAILAALLLFLILKMRKQNKNYQKEIQQLIRS